MTSERKSIDSTNGISENLDDVLSISNDDSSNEIEIIKELKVNLEDHRCDLCCEGEFLVDKLLRFGGLIDNKYKFVCDKCDKNFICKSVLRRHSFNCTGPAFDPIMTINRNISVKTKGSPNSPLVCSDCNITFKSQGGLTRHKRSKHSLRTHTCEVCKKVFSNFGQFRCHCFKHSQTKYFKQKNKHKAVNQKDSVDIVSSS